MLLGRIWEWRSILNAGKEWLHLWQIMVILFAYLVIYNSHVQKKINLSQFVSEAFKVTTTHVLQIIKGIIFYVVRSDMRMTANFECRKKWLRLWQIMVILFVYLVIFNLHVKKKINSSQFVSETFKVITTHISRFPY